MAITGTTEEKNLPQDSSEVVIEPILSNDLLADPFSAEPPSINLEEWLKSLSLDG
jgi:hypothetical protein